MIDEQYKWCPFLNRICLKEKCMLYKTTEITGTIVSGKCGLLKEED